MSPLKSLAFRPEGRWHYGVSLSLSQSHEQKPIFCREINATGADFSSAGDQPTFAHVADQATYILTNQLVKNWLVKIIHDLAIASLHLVPDVVSSLTMPRGIPAGQLR